MNSRIHTTFFEIYANSKSLEMNLIKGIILVGMGLGNGTIFEKICLANCTTLNMLSAGPYPKFSQEYLLWKPHALQTAAALSQQRIAYFQLLVQLRMHCERASLLSQGKNVTQKQCKDLKRLNSNTSMTLHL